MYLQRSLKNGVFLYTTDLLPAKKIRKFLFTVITFVECVATYLTVGCNSFSLESVKKRIFFIPLKIVGKIELFEIVEKKYFLREFLEAEIYFSPFNCAVIKSHVPRIFSRLC